MPNELHSIIRRIRLVQGYFHPLQGKLLKLQGVKVGMMGPLAGVGDPVFWFTARPILGALGASLAMGGSILGPIDVSSFT